MERPDILPPDVVIRRLPLYARSLRYLLQEGILSVSSQELGERINVTAAQIRKDLSYFGEFGKQGIGYDVEKLLNHIENILGLTHEWPVALVGVGHLGQAIARYEGFRSKGIYIVALFDNDAEKVGEEVAGLTIQSDEHIPAIVREHGIRLAIVAVPAARAQQVTDMLVAAGVLAGFVTPPMLVALAGVLAVMMVTTIPYPDLHWQDALVMGVVQAMAILLTGFPGRVFAWGLLFLALAYTVAGPRFYWRR